MRAVTAAHHAAQATYIKSPVTISAADRHTLLIAAGVLFVLWLLARVTRSA